MYQVFLSKQAAKESKRRGMQFKSEIVDILTKLSLNPRPSQSEKLTGKLNFIFSYHFSFTGTAFRLAYLIDEHKKTITIVMVGPRENFYKTLRQKLG